MRRAGSLWQQTDERMNTCYVYAMARALIFDYLWQPNSAAATVV